MQQEIQWKVCQSVKRRTKKEGGCRRKEDKGTCTNQYNATVYDESLPCSRPINLFVAGQNVIPCDSSTDVVDTPKRGGIKHVLGQYVHTLYQVVFRHQMYAQSVPGSNRMYYSN